MTSSSSTPTSANTRPPEWSRDGDQAFASSVMKGVEARHDGLVGMVNTTRKVRRRKLVDLDELAAGVRAGNRTLLAVDGPSFGLCRKKLQIREGKT